MDIWREVLHPDHACCDKTIRTTHVPLPTKRNRANTVIARTPLPNLQHPVGAIVPPFLNCHKSAIIISCESDVVQALPLPKAGAHQNVPQPKASGDHNVPQHRMATFEVPNQFMESIVLTKTARPINFDGKYSMVDEAWKLAIHAQDRQRALAGPLVGAPSVCQLPGGSCIEIDPQPREAVSVYPVSCSSIGLMMILNLESYIVQTED